MDQNRFSKLVESIDEMKAHRRGEIDLPADRIRFVDEPDPRDVRKALGLNQSDFAHVLGVSIKTVQNWEQGRRSPRGPAKKLLEVAASHPDVLLRLA